MTKRRTLQTIMAAYELRADMKYRIHTPDESGVMVLDQLTHKEAAMEIGKAIEKETPFRIFTLHNLFGTEVATLLRAHCDKEFQARVSKMANSREGVAL